MANEKMVKLDDLLKSRGWEKMKELIKNRQMALANKIIYGDCMDVADEHITPSDLLRAEMRCLAWVVEKLPTQMIENPDYKAEEDIEEMEEEERVQLVNDMFKQEVQFYIINILKMVSANEYYAESKKAVANSKPNLVKVKEVSYNKREPKHYTKEVKVKKD